MTLFTCEVDRLILPSASQLTGCLTVFNSFCFKVVTSDTEEVICRSIIRSALDKGNSNQRPSNQPPPPGVCDTPPTNGELDKDLSKVLNEAQCETQPIPSALIKYSTEIPIILENASGIQEPEIPSQHTHFFDSNNLVRKIFSRECEVDGTVQCAEIIERVENSETVTDQFLVRFSSGKRTEVMNYNAIINKI